MAVLSGATFPSTQWSLIACLQSEGEGSRQAAETLAARYWAPVYAYLVNWGMTREQAADTTQAFFADVVLTRGIFERAKPEIGRLRGLMRTSLRNYIVDLKRAAGKRSPAAPLPLTGNEEHILQPLAGLAPEHAFDKRWALALFHETLERCEEHYSRPGLAKNWAAFDAWILRDARSWGTPSAAHLAAQLGFRTDTDLRAAVQTVKKRILSVMRDVVGEQVLPGEDPEAEYQEVLALLR
jgi:RNA polymerase sigma-70 factor (ECF subfamily)